MSNGGLDSGIGNFFSLPPPLSDPCCETRRTMKTLVNFIHEPRHLHLIARFGAARLFERPDGRAELRGGTEAERTEAKEWLSLFEHETVLHVAPEDRPLRLRVAPRILPDSPMAA